MSFGTHIGVQTVLFLVKEVVSGRIVQWQMGRLVYGILTSTEVSARTRKCVGRYFIKIFQGREP